MSDTYDTSDRVDNFCGLLSKESPTSDVSIAYAEAKDDHERRAIIKGWLASKRDKKFQADFEIGCIMRKLFVDSDDAERIYIPCLDKAAAIYAGVIAELDRLRNEYAPQPDIEGFPYKIGSVVIAAEATLYGGYFYSTSA